MPKKKPVKKKAKTNLPPFVVIVKGNWYVKRNYATTEFSANGRRIYFQPTVRCIPETAERAEAIAKQIHVEVRAMANTHSGPVVQFNDLCTRWLGVKKASLASSTYETYGYVIDGLLKKCPDLAERPFGLVTTMDMQNVYSTLLNAGTSTEIVRKTNKIVEAIFEQAMKWGIASGNPTIGVVLPKAKDRDVSAFERHEARALLTAIQTDLKYFVFEFALVTAMRPQEYLALSWSDINWERRLVHVRRALEKNSTKEPKTLSGKRTIELPEEFMDRLRVWKEYQEKGLAKLTELADAAPLLPHMKRKGVNYKKRIKRIKLVNERIDRIKDLDLIFPSEKGGYWSVGYVRDRLFKPLLELAKLEHKRFTPYSLRHTSISLALAGGADVKSVSQRAGHSNSSFTLDVYGHSMAHAQERTTGILKNEIYGG